MNGKEYVPCPYCGEEIRRDARSCLHCGSDERTGWSHDTYLDGIGIPDESDYEQIVATEFGHSEKRRSKAINWKRVVGALLLIGFIVLVLFRY